MSAPQADKLDPAGLAGRGASIERRYDLGSFARLGDLLVATDGEARVRLRFFAADRDLPGCELELDASPIVRCERCLETFGLPVATSSRLAFVASEEQAAAIPEGFEPVITADGRVDLHELVEDELLLALPIVALHGDDSPCAEAGAAPAEAVAEEPIETRRPFAALRDLLKN